MSIPSHFPDRFVLLLTKNLCLGAPVLRQLMEAKRVKTYSAHSKLSQLFQLLADAKCIAHQKDRQKFWMSTRGWRNKYYFSVFAPTGVASTMLYLKHPQEVFLGLNVTRDELTELDKLVTAYDQENRALEAWERAVEHLAHTSAQFPQNPLIQDVAKTIDFDAMRVDANDPRNTSPARLRQRISDWLAQHQVK